MEKYFKKIEIITDKASAIRSTSYSINELFENKEDFYKNIVDTIFDIKNLALYLTGISSEDDFLVEDTDDVMSIFQGLFKNPETYYDDIVRSNKALDGIVNANTEEEIFHILFENGYIQSMPELLKEENSSIENIKKHWKKVLLSDTSYGYFGEIIFYTCLRKIFKKSLLISKLFYVTASGTFAHGSDGIFYEDSTKTLIFGEAKFTNDLISGLNQALYSLSDFEKRVNDDINVIVKSKQSVKSDSLTIVEELKCLHKKDIEKMNRNIFVFIMHGKELKDDELIPILEEKIKTFDSRIPFTTYIISFPIIDKKELITKISRKVQMHE